MIRFLKYFASVVVLALTTGSVLFLQPAHGQTPGDIPVVDGEPLRMITVTGTGQVDAEPDYAVIRVGVQTQAETAQPALAENNQRVEELLNALEQAGIAREDIQTQVVQLLPRYDQPPEPMADNGGITGYTASNVVEVNVQNLDELGQLLDSAIEAGGNVIESIQFQVSNQAELQAQAREAAVENAREKAEQLASLAGASLGDVLVISSVEGIPGPIPASMMMQAEAAAAVPIRPGTEQIQAQVQVTWRLQ